MEWPAVSLKRYTEQRKFSLPVGEVFMGETSEASESIVERETYVPEAALKGLVEDALDLIERLRGGDEKLPSEEYYARRDALRAALHSTPLVKDDDSKSVSHDG